MLTATIPPAHFWGRCTAPRRHNKRQATSCSPSSNPPWRPPPAYHPKRPASPSLGLAPRSTRQHDKNASGTSAAQHNNAARSFIPVVRLFADGRRFFAVSSSLRGPPLRVLFQITGCSHLNRTSRVFLLHLPGLDPARGLSCRVERTISPSGKFSTTRPLPQTPTLQSPRHRPWSNNAPWFEGIVLLFVSLEHNGYLDGFRQALPGRRPGRARPLPLHRYSYHSTTCRLRLSLVRARPWRFSDLRKARTRSTPCRYRQTHGRSRQARHGVGPAAQGTRGSTQGGGAARGRGGTVAGSQEEAHQYREGLQRGCAGEC